MMIIKIVYNVDKDLHYKVLYVKIILNNVYYQINNQEYVYYVIKTIY